MDKKENDPGMKFCWHNIHKTFETTGNIAEYSMTLRSHGVFHPWGTD